MLDKEQRRLRRARKTRAKIREKGEKRLSVFRSANHIYAQVIDDSQGYTLVSASTVDKEVAQSIERGGNTVAAKKVGEVLGRRAQEAGIKKVAFDRGGYQYHGRVQALAEGARESGLGL